MNVLRSFVRALRLHCPNCGSAGLRSGWMGIVTRCPGCGIRFDRGETDYFLGGYTINLFAALLLAVVVAVLAIAHPDWPRLALYGAAIPVIVLVTLWFYPISRVLWLAFDLAFRGPSAKDFEK